MVEKHHALSQWKIHLLQKSLHKRGQILESKSVNGGYDCFVKLEELYPDEREPIFMDDYDSRKKKSSSKLELEIWEEGGTFTCFLLTK